ncbi:MAG: thioredoxin family protein [Verrucomicrobia bacterium]|nr:thioredoxin family protein [Verrucomicrobiota bacterium]
MFGRFLALLAAAFLVAPLSAQMQGGVELVQASLVAQPTEPGAASNQVRVGVKLVMAKDWHTYWKNSGDYGLPTEVEWKLPEGWKAGPLLWPLPHRITAGDIVTFGYDDEVVLLTDLTAPSTAAVTEAALRQVGAKVAWLVCKESCIPGDAEVTLTNPGRGPDAALTALFAKFAAQLPRAYEPAAAGFTVARTLDDKGLTLTVRGLSASVVQKADFYPLPNDSEVSLVAPKLESTADGYRIRIEFGQPTKKGAGVTGVLAFDRGGRREGWEFSARDLGGSGTAGATPAAGTGSVANATAGSGGGQTPPTADGSLLYYLLLGFLGGLILNAMPCVLPVLSLKILSFLGQAGEEPKKVFRLGLAYSAGVFVWFLSIALLMILFGLAYGEQFGQPAFMVGITVIIFVFALSLLGVFEFTLPGSLQNKAAEASQGSGYLGAFSQGLLATVLGASCTAPLLGAAVGFASGKPAALVLAMFAMVSLGMAAPVLLLCAFPAWMRLLPRPGTWMEHFRQGSGFVLLATIVYYLYVIGAQKGPNGIVWTAALLVVVAIACWIYGTFLTPSSPAATQRRAWVALVLVLAGGGWFTLGQIRAAEARPSELAEKGGIPWEKYSSARVEAAVAAGTPVFVDFTADWCVNCKFNEKTVLETEAVRGALREKGFLALKGDWTRSDPEITKVLRRYQRAGVPLYLVYAGGKAEPQVLPELLTKQIVLDALNAAAPAKSQKVALADGPAGGR